MKLAVRSASWDSKLSEEAITFNYPDRASHVLNALKRPGGRACSLNYRLGGLDSIDGFVVPR